MKAWSTRKKLDGEKKDNWIGLAEGKVKEGRGKGMAKREKSKANVQWKRKRRKKRVEKKTDNKS